MVGRNRFCRMPGRVGTQWQLLLKPAPVLRLGPASCLQSPHSLHHHSFSLCKYHRLCDTEPRRKNFSVDSSEGLFWAFCSEHSIIVRFIFLCTSEHFPSYSRAQKGWRPQNTERFTPDQNIPWGGGTWVARSVK